MDALNIVARRGRTKVRGASLIEILVTILVLSFGLLGLAGLQARLQKVEMEAYQRSQALLLVKDMANRLAANRFEAAAYADGAPVTSPLGAGTECPATSATSTLATKDLSEWCNALQGAGETRGATSERVGALIGGRGCVEPTATSNEYLVSVVWQGLTPLSAATSTGLCGGGTTYDTAAAACADNRCRRAVSTVVRIGSL